MRGTCTNSRFVLNIILSIPVIWRSRYLVFFFCFFVCVCVCGFCLNSLPALRPLTKAILMNTLDSMPSYIQKIFTITGTFVNLSGTMLTLNVKINNRIT